LEEEHAPRSLTEKKPGTLSGVRDSDMSDASGSEEDDSDESEGSISDSEDSDTEWDEEKLIKANDRKYWNR